LKLLWFAAACLAAQDISFVTMTPNGVAKVHEGQQRAHRRLSPCSTFKIPNSAIGLETGVVSGPKHVKKYDESKHKSQAFWPEEWSRDHDLKSAFRVSAVWYFVEMAKETGPGNMAAFLKRFDYGNRDSSPWPAPFWIGSTLRISPLEQVQFLDRLFRNDFGLQPSTVAALEDFMRQKSAGAKTLFYKTGACTDAEAGPQVWLVGFVQDGTQRTYFAMNAGAATFDPIFDKRVAFARERLAKLGLFPAD